MKHVDSFPHAIREIPHTEIPMPDGCRLAARIWMPADANDTPVPAILEYLPYRKNDLTVERDASMQPYLAGHGYAVVRLDLRGSGDSDGLMKDEYLPQELEDGRNAISWIADQPWCDGNVGMIGISWGGFNGLQIAAMQPPALKAIITLCSTDDRYADDVHYMGGCLLGEQLSWASIMFGYNTLPPDPANAGDRWREMWQSRLQGSGLWLKNWLLHQTRDEFWKHGSVCEDWSRIRIPVYAVSGWADGYPRSVFRLMENLEVPRKGLVGPWAHRYPHLGEPGPAIGFLQEELRWWDHWLKGRATGIMDEPMLRLYMQDSVPPRGWYGHRSGRWVAEPSWPSPNIRPTAFFLTAKNGLSPDTPAEGSILEHSSPANVGMASGKWCGYSKPGDAPLDQRGDDAGSLCFETAPLEEPFEIVGDAKIRLRLAVDKPVAQIAVRIVDVHPDGTATRVSFGVLNLTHRNGHETPEPLVPGEVYTVTVPMKHVAQRFPAGHRLRIAISTSYFPMIWPAPEPVCLLLHTQGCLAELPVRHPSHLDQELRDLGAPEAGVPAEKDLIEAPDRYFNIVENAATGQTEMRIADGLGRFRPGPGGPVLYKQGYETYSVSHDDLASASGRAEWMYGFERDDLSIRSETETTLTADRNDFIIHARMQVWENGLLAADRKWNVRIRRNHV